ncbi:hypothetical protein CULCOIPH002_16130 [Corynebacterium ulcerans]|uniref:Uncharacterized protein n=1 Tax=Corynebacterium ulcerans TaxID=65058 RepID=A0ABD0BHK8_CORUL|nr:hypothetical protein CULCOIPH001_09700 [Corynebacterium ulcerans]GJJ36701.1 hypothetical protein CULCOIPH002_16130 [Corynebacterium ulcerans]GJJ37741.1 hypothetical protein CULCOIPH003_03720 [Corynebacterium ulcerans]GJJ40485.1 hypothetical protein CULCOIPH004_08960 [Corynebacterium ulcerans]GJJ43687.1 hypothetical protein CULCOIPH005_18760 [Corynebacterium ulcerans]
MNKLFSGIFPTQNLTAKSNRDSVRRLGISDGNGVGREVQSLCLRYHGAWITPPCRNSNDLKPLRIRFNNVEGLSADRTSAA